MNWNTSMLLRCGLATSPGAVVCARAAAQTNRVSAPPPDADGIGGCPRGIVPDAAGHAGGGNAKAQLATRRPKLTEKYASIRRADTRGTGTSPQNPELRWYLQPLMTGRLYPIAPYNSRLIPESLRNGGGRITQWDKFPPVAQRIC